ncbi:uncharacterized protein BDV17DRAFT_295991 [Aspergillus undulatus]|uniref:uncharacterized protein n=1 Tax=Aspergillus undulatus TaxID=1810928 RepID=UPI003CCE4FB0
MARTNPPAPDPSSSSNATIRTSTTTSASTASSSSLAVSALISTPSPTQLQAQLPPQPQTQAQTQRTTTTTTTTTPDTLLWAHHLRQENIHLSKTMDRLSAMFTKATNAISNLDRNVGQLAEGIHALEQQRELDKREYDERIQELGEKVQACAVRAEKLEEASANAGEGEGAGAEADAEAEAENAALKSELERAMGKFGALESENQTLRRDVVGVLKRFDELQGDNATLRQRITVLEQENATLRGEVSDTAQRFTALESETAALEQGINGIGNGDSDRCTQTQAQAQAEQFDDMKASNELLRERVSELEKLLEVQGKQVNRALKWLSMKTMAEDKERNSKRDAKPHPKPEPRPTASAPNRTQSAPSLDADHDTIIPDAMPTPPSAHSRHRTSSFFPTRTLSETTWGSLTDLESTPKPPSQPPGLPHPFPRRSGPSPLRNGKKASTEDHYHGHNHHQNKDHTTQLESMRLRQDGRRLEKYLEHAGAMRALHPSIPEAAFVMAFQNGLDDEAVKARVVELTRNVGLSWERVRSYLQVYCRDQDQGKARGQGDRDRDIDGNGKAKAAVDTPPPPVKRDATGDSLGRRKGKRGRRSIPIVPSDDDDDELFVT